MRCFANSRRASRVSRRIALPRPWSFALTIKGENLRPYMRVSADNLQAVDFLFQKHDAGRGRRSYNLPPGQYDIILYDQAQERFRLPNALTVRHRLARHRNCRRRRLWQSRCRGRGEDHPGHCPLAPRRCDCRRQAVARSHATSFPSPGLVGVPIANALRLPAVVLFRCYVRAQQGRPSCVVEDAVDLAAGTTVLPMRTAKIPFQVEQVRSPHPLEAVPIQIRLIATPRSCH